jgi:hypothetical protein
MNRTLILAAGLALVTATTYAASPNTNSSHRLSMNGVSGTYMPGSAISRTPTYANPNVPGATGRTIVIGDPSTIAGDREATRDAQTGVFSAD